jgi:hypothetical protein
MSDRHLESGARAPDFLLRAAHSGDIVDMSLQTLLDGNRGVVLTTYVFDFSGG